jgi:hypothetical protein
MLRVIHYSSPSIVQVIKSRRIRWADHVARMGRSEACTGFFWKNLRKRDHWGDRHRWEDNHKADLQEMGCGVIDWIELAKDRDRWRSL